jgi:branched-chain amino acid transport system substrate-binding protein
MNRSPQSEWLPFLLAGLVTLGSLGSGLWWVREHWSDPKASKSVENLGIAWPDRPQSLAGGTLSPPKAAGIIAMGNRNYAEAESSLMASLQQAPNDPEARVFVSNAQVLKALDPSQADGKVGGQAVAFPHLVIGVSVPLGKNVGEALEILRGVAQAQQELNQAMNPANRLPEGRKLLVAIADDRNDPAQAQAVAHAFGQQAAAGAMSQVQAVVGLQTSDVALKGTEAYTQEKLIAISPSATSVKLTGVSPYFLRTAPSDYLAGRTLANYLLTQTSWRKLVVYFDSSSIYSESLKNELSTALLLGGGQVVGEFDFHSPTFSASATLQEARQRQAEAVALLPSTPSLDQALQVVTVNQRRLPLVGGDSVYSQKTLEVGQTAGVGMVLAVAWHRDGVPGCDFKQRAKQLWQADVSWRTAMAYDATMAIAAGLAAQLKKSPTPNRTELGTILRDPDLQVEGSSCRPVKFQASGDRQLQETPLVVIRAKSGSEAEPPLAFEAMAPP